MPHFLAPRFGPLRAPLAELAGRFSTIAVACSGGLDSIALLHAAKHAGLNPTAMHIDHGIHADSASWAETVHAFAVKLGIRFTSQRLSGLQANMPNLENAARNARHNALNVLAQQHGVDCVLLAHHANDQAETVLLNLLRGTGLGGVGMPMQRTTQGICWVRPWLDVPRSEVAVYAAASQLEWIEDPSNLDLSLRRNAVRHQVWPLVQAVEPRALPSLLRFSSIALEAAQTEHALAAHWIEGYIRNECVVEGQGIDWHGMVKHQPTAVQVALLRAWLAQLGCKPPTQAHAHAMLGQLNAKTGSGLRCMHDGWEFGFEGKTLRATQANTPKH